MSDTLTIAPVVPGLPEGAHLFTLTNDDDAVLITVDASDRAVLNAAWSESRHRGKRAIAAVHDGTLIAFSFDGSGDTIEVFTPLAPKSPFTFYPERLHSDRVWKQLSADLV